jgi:dihydropteroate synthase
MLSFPISEPLVMGILNLSPDSFYDGGKYIDPEKALIHAQKMIEDGADILDLGAISTRPGADLYNGNEEWKRLKPALELIRSEFPKIILSVDTFRSEIAEKSVAAGADIINDISGGTMDEKMLSFVGESKIPYVLMHIQGTPQTMQENPQYEDVVKEVKAFFIRQIEKLQELGAEKIILDPGFGFGKTMEQNYKLLNAMDEFSAMTLPVLAGLSRKSMLTKLLGITKEEALNATIIANTIALMKGAKILRVHDVKEAKECVRVVSSFNG